MVNSTYVFFFEVNLHFLLLFGATNTMDVGLFENFIDREDNSNFS